MSVECAKQRREWAERALRVSKGLKNPSPQSIAFWESKVVEYKEKEEEEQIIKKSGTRRR